MVVGAGVPDGVGDGVADGLDEDPGAGAVVAEGVGDGEVLGDVDVVGAGVGVRACDDGRFAAGEPAGARGPGDVGAVAGREGPAGWDRPG